VFRKIVFAAVPLAAVAALTLSGGAQAAVGPTIYTSTVANGGNSVAGWSAFAPGTFTLTHIEAYQGSSGHSEWENLPVDAALASAHVGQTLSLPTQQPQGGIGMALCDRNTGGLGEAAQLGIINVGGGLFDEVEGLGAFGTTVLNSSGDVCDNGILGAAPGSHAFVIRVLLTGIRANDTVQGGIAYNAKQNYTFGGHVVAKGDITFYATDLSNPTDTNEDFLGGGTFLPQPLVTNEADVGVVSDTAASIPLPGGSLIPAPNGGSLESVAPNEFARFAHVKLSANSTVIGHHTVSGAGAFEAAGVPWNVYPVASTSDGTAGGILKMIPQQFAADNFADEGGIGLV
jgi:hypothetical protein